MCAVHVWRTWVSCSAMLCLLPLGRGQSLNPEQAGGQQPQSPSSSAHGTGVVSTYTWLSTWALEIWTQGHMFRQQVLLSAESSSQSPLHCLCANQNLSLMWNKHKAICHENLGFLANSESFKSRSYRHLKFSSHPGTANQQIFVLVIFFFYYFPHFVLQKKGSDSKQRLWIIV